MKKLFLSIFMLVLLIPVVLADEEAFPEWTHWVEIYEHLAMFAISIITMAFLSIRYEENKKFKTPIKIAVIGFGVFALSEFLTILHHFFIYPFGVWNAIVNHGLLLVAIVIIGYSLIKFANKKKSSTSTSD